MDKEFDTKLAELMTVEEPGKKKRKFLTKKKIIVGASAAAVILFAGKVLFGGGGGAPYVQTGTVSRGYIEQSLSINGPISGTDSVDVVSNLHAEILTIPVKLGDQVTKGQIIATLDASDLTREVEIAQNAYDLAVANYEEQQVAARNGYAKAQQAYSLARAAYERNSVLFAAGDISQVEMENAKSAMDSAALDVSGYTVENGQAVPPDSYRLQIESARFELEKKKEQLENAEIKSPIDGTVVRVNTKVGRFADTTENDVPLFVIENLDVLEMKINVSEYSIGQIKKGQEAVITADILNGREVKGVVTDISPTGEEKGGGSTQRVIPTTIRILENDTALIAGITARAELVFASAGDALQVPMSCVYQTAEGQTAVAAVENGKVRIVPVETGVESDLNIEVKPADGAELNEGTAVILSPSPELYDGMAAAPTV